MSAEQEPMLREAAKAVGDSDAIRLLAELVAIAPTNLEDPTHGRWEKPNYARAAERIARAARSYGLGTRIYDPVSDPAVTENFHGGPRPNVVVDLERGLSRRLLILAHFDVVPVPEEQLGRWKTPPHVLSLRADGRMYGRGSNDDLGSGVIGALTAMRRLVERPDLSWNVRLVACCDEETGGAGGVEAIKARDDRLPMGSPERILLADAALIPDGDPHTSAASSGVAFGDGRFERPVPLSDAVAFGRELVSLNAMARSWKSQYPSPDWPDHGAPEPVITGRASVTRFDLESKDGSSGGARIRRIHAETDASNQVAQTVTFLMAGPSDATRNLAAEMERRVPAPYRWQAGGRTALVAGTDDATYQLVGESTHGGYPHRGHNPVPVALELVSQVVEEGRLAGSSLVQATFALDLRLPPEMELAQGTKEARAHIDAWRHDHPTAAILEFPPERCRGGYALAMDHPLVRHVDRVLVDAFGKAGIYGEYGGTDASSLTGVRTPDGEQLPAVVFGSMDRQSHIHEAEESVDPSALRGVIHAIEQFATEP